MSGDGVDEMYRMAIGGQSSGMNARPATDIEHPHRRSQDTTDQFLRSKKFQTAVCSPEQAIALRAGRIVLYEISSDTACCPPTSRDQTPISCTSCS